MFSIGSFARLGGISAKQLRAYDALGLFRPLQVDPSSGYRFYSPAQLPELRRILALRQLGMSLDEIGRLIIDGSDLRAALERRRTELEREAHLVEQRLQALEISISDEHGLDVVIRPIHAESVAVMTVAAGCEVGEAFYELEAYVRDAGRRAARPPGAIPSAREIFLPLSGAIADTDHIGFRRSPACRAASLMHRGPYRGLAAARRALERWVVAAGLRAVGPTRIVYLQFGAEPELRVPRGYVVERESDFLSELQLPVA